jgi:UDP-N-acetylglucosamine 2-epimerase (non-hydrolysing)
MAPVLRALDDFGIQYRLIHTCQHNQIVQDLSQCFGLRPPDVRLCERQSDPRSVRDLLSWAIACARGILSMCPKERRKSGGYLVVHGDTPSTLIGVVAGLLWKRRIVHVEAGLRSFCLTEPFPEEMIRILTTTASRVLFCPSPVAARNITRRRGKLVIDTGYNTVLDVVRFALERRPTLPRIPTPYSVALFHRQETIYSRRRIMHALEAVETAGQRFPVQFILHTPTRHRLERYGLLDRLRCNPRVTIHGYMDYVNFMNMLIDAEFVITDGGGLQEETYIVNKPCLLLRNTTEREIGLGETAFLAKFNRDRIHFFLDHYRSFSSAPDVEGISPSTQIACSLAKLVQQTTEVGT